MESMVDSILTAKKLLTILMSISLLTLIVVLITVPTQAFVFKRDSCITDATPSFVRGYYDAHSDVYFNSTYNPNEVAPHKGNNTSYNELTGEKIVEQNATANYIAGYRLGWQHAQQRIFEIDC